MIKKLIIDFLTLLLQDRDYEVTKVIIEINKKKR